jgi:hypothetical protein
MQDSDTDRWQLILAAVLLVLIASGIYVARHEGPLILTSGSHKAAVGAKHRSKQGTKAEASAARSGSAEATDASDAAVDGLEDCRSEAPAEAQTRELPIPPQTALQAAVALVDSDRTAAMGAMRALGNYSVPNAYLAYLLLDVEKAEEARPVLARARHGLNEPACILTLQDPNDKKRSQIALALRTLRLAIESTQVTASEIPLACSVFVTHPKEAVWAFGGVWGSSADKAAGAMKAHCVKMLVRRAAPGVERSVLQAHDKLYDALLRTRAMPEGAMYDSVYVVVGNIIRDAILAPELVTFADERVAESELDQMATDDLALAVRIAAYQKDAAAQAAPIGKGICAVLSVRDKAADARTCEHIAQKTALEALHYWLSATAGGKGR